MNELTNTMKALISNDDGITASGILASKKAVEDLCDTYVVAPETQQSGIGHALTLYEPLRVNEYTLKDGSLGYVVSGTPTDAVTIALFEIMEKKVLVETSARHIHLTAEAVEIEGLGPFLHA